MELAGKVGLVTGGTKGIGAAAAVALARAGADVAINGRADDAAARAVKASIESLGRRAEVIVGDCARPAEARRVVEDTVKRLGRVDVVVHSAGGLVAGGLFEVKDEDWYAGFDVHVHAIFHLCRAAIPDMRRRKEGAIILISSTAGKLSLPTNVAYQVVKGAIPHFTRALAREFAPDNIRVNCVAPGVVRTRFHDKMTPEQQALNLQQRIPLRREGTPEQVASLIVELVKNDYITGDTVTIDGGLTMRIA
jgi:NAD(P)-dependent dehydrogenase (short-subunit alcohol dehydrogenase family)